jgi:hypothetical protein
MPATEFACKEPGCEKKVVYEREVTSGLFYGTLKVYLTCEDDHTHLYLVSM